MKYIHKCFQSFKILESDSYFDDNADDMVTRYLHLSSLTKKLFIYIQENKYFRKVYLPKPVVTNKFRIDKIVGSVTPAFRIELLGLDMETRNSYNSPFKPTTVSTSKHNLNCSTY